MVAHHCHGPGGVQGEEGTQGGQGKSRYLHGHSNLSSHNAKKRIHSSSGIVSDTIAVGIGMTQGRHLAEKTSIPSAVFDYRIFSFFCVFYGVC